jgi:ABC-2 type transport system permease protein
MPATAKLAIVEAKLLARDFPSLFFSVAFPAILLVVLGSFFPGAQDPSPDLGGLRFVDIYAPIVIALGLASAALAVMPGVLAGYRQYGVLRRMATTPVGPARLLTAQLGVQIGAASIGAAAAVVALVAVFASPAPQNAPGFVLAFVLAAAAIFGLGLLVAAVARTSGAAQGVGMLLYFPTLFFSGVYFPREGMPEAMRAISDLTPLGAGVQALSDTWAGQAAAPANLLVMAAWAIVTWVVATRVFRWE